MAKSRLAPMKQMTIPRMELLAATTSVKLDAVLRKELGIDILKSYFWTGSMIMLYYIVNEDKVFPTSFADRVNEIYEGSVTSQWQHVDSAFNPAGDISRVLTSKALISSLRWFWGPDFIMKMEDNWPAGSVDMSRVCAEHIEHRKTWTIYTTYIQEDTIIDTLLTEDHHGMS